MQCLNLAARCRPGLFERQALGHRHEMWARIPYNNVGDGPSAGPGMVIKAPLGAAKGSYPQGQHCQFCPVARDLDRIRSIYWLYTTGSISLRNVGDASPQKSTNIDKIDAAASDIRVPPTGPEKNIRVLRKAFE
jgi:hypothetical protein